MRQVFVDTETTGLNPGLHEIVELAWSTTENDAVRVARPKHTLNWAEPKALEVNRYFERGLHKGLYKDDVPTPLLLDFIQDVQGAELVGANVAFDAAFLTQLIGFAPWHYRLLDVEVFARAVLGLDETPGLAKIASILLDRGHAITAPAHTAESDVLCMRACYDALVAINANR